MDNSPHSSQEAPPKPKSSLTERLALGVSILILLGSIGGVWLNGNNKSVEQAARIYNLEQRVEELSGVNGDIRELKTTMNQVREGNRNVTKALQDLAESQNELAVAIGKLQERTSGER